MKIKYNFFKNWGYAMKGLGDVLKTEMSFRIELVFVVIFSIVNLFLPINLTLHLVLEMALFGVFITEILNSAIERIVDLVSPEWNELAGKAKDAGSAGVFLSITIAVICWVLVLANLIFGNL